jgi:hypothetical protein
MTADIRSNIRSVDALRSARAGVTPLESSVLAIKSLQSQRFACCYSDLLASERFGSATRFFLSELYGTRDFSLRDAQFARIAGTIERLFPASVLHLASDLSVLHALSEYLDDAMARLWLDLPHLPKAERYVAAWRLLKQPVSRQKQLDLALHIGRSLDKLTATLGLRTMLKLMRSPAAAAGLSDLQTFLETGFDTFHDMRRSKGACAAFLDTIAQRETAWMAHLFDTSRVDFSQSLSFA